MKVGVTYAVVNELSGKNLVKVLPPQTDVRHMDVPELLAIDNARG
jgi:hypothetical protein